MMRSDGRADRADAMDGLDTTTQQGWATRGGDVSLPLGSEHDSVGLRAVRRDVREWACRGLEEGGVSEREVLTNT